MGAAEFILCCFAVWGLFRFADALALIAASVNALAKAVGDE